MQDALQYIAYAIGLGLNVLVIRALLRGSYQHYPFVFGYTLALLLSTLIEMAVRAAPAWLQKDYKYYYWADEIILDVLVFCMVIAFIDDAARHATQKFVRRHWLVLGAVLICAASIAVHRSAHFNRRMTLVSRDLNICAVVLDVMLWTLLIAARRPDRCLMLLSGGLGLQLTGAIMGEQLRQFSRHLFLTGTLLEVIAGFVGLYVWWRALKPISQEKPATA